MSPILLAAPLLASCASLPPVEIQGTGSWPPRAGYQINHDGTDLSSAFAAAIETELGARGFTDSQGPDYLVQIAGSDLPGKTGLFLPDARLEHDDQQQWLSSPTPARSIRTRRLVVTISETSSGREIYRLHGSERYRSGQTDNGERLLSTLLAQLPQR